MQRSMFLVTGSDAETEWWHVLLYTVMMIALVFCTVKDLIEKFKRQREQQRQEAELQVAMQRFQPRTNVPTLRSSSLSNHDIHQMEAAAGAAAANNESQLLVERMLQGVILNSKNDEDKDGCVEQFADFGTGDPLPVELCTICLISYEQGDHVVTSSCKHVFHRDCILEWVLLNKHCPCCRQVFVDLQSPTVQPVLAIDQMVSRSSHRQ